MTDWRRLLRVSDNTDRLDRTTRRRMVIATACLIGKAFVLTGFLAGQAFGGIVVTTGDSPDACHAHNPPANSPIARSEQKPVVGARYIEATDTYQHGVLGDAIEAGALLVLIDDGNGVHCKIVEAGERRVFEDTSPRLADLDGDGINEVVAVASHANRGARLEIYGYPKGGADFQLLATTPYIGTPYRWLAPVGSADLDGDGQIEIAYVDRPHLAKTLRVWRYKTGHLEPVASLPGLSNHRIGWPFVVGGIRDCGSGPELVLPSGDWQSIQAIMLSESGGIRAREVRPYQGAESVAVAMKCDD